MDNGGGVRVELAFRSLSYTVRKGAQGSLPVLKGVTGMIPAAQVTAILGPTGAGKSTLLDVLAMRKRAEWVDGTVFVMGKPQSPAFTRMCGYVTQDDLLLGNMTVRENIAFSAALRLPQDLYSAAKRDVAIESVLAELGLAKVKDSLIGNDMIRGISGG